MQNPWKARASRPLEVYFLNRDNRGGSRCNSTILLNVPVLQYSSKAIDDTAVEIILVQGIYTMAKIEYLVMTVLNLRRISAAQPRAPRYRNETAHSEQRHVALAILQYLFFATTIGGICIMDPKWTRWRQMVVAVESALNVEPQRSFFYSLPVELKWPGPLPHIVCALWTTVPSRQRHMCH